MDQCQTAQSVGLETLSQPPLLKTGVCPARLSPCGHSRPSPRHKSLLPHLSVGNISRLSSYPTHGDHPMWTLLQDLRFALRQFRKSPGFVITAILSLMLGIGATTAIFSVIYGVLLDPYPYKDNDRMVHVQLNDKKSGRGPLFFVNASGYKDLKKVSSLDEVFLQRQNQRNLTGNQIPVSVNVGLYSPNLFQYMGVTPLLGRAFSPDD